MKNFIFKILFFFVVTAFSFIALQSFNPPQSNGADGATVKCRKSTTEGDYCYSGGKTIAHCANNTIKNDCDQTGGPIVPTIPD